jgi:hypothetical protein
MRLFATLHLAFLPFLASSFVLNPALSNHLTLTNLTLPLLRAMVPHCVRITDPPMTGLKPTVCENIVSIHCRIMDEIPVEVIGRNKWIWTEEPGCAMGWYFPRHARLPTLGSCEAIHEGMVERCARDSSFNGAAVNVAELPNFGDDGKVLSEDRGMFIMAPERMTL